jgi:D-glycero-alpha-D-manno-heptose-7-phosphate kinase
VVISRTPLRVSFVGGGSDLPSFADEQGGAVVSTGIDKYIHVIVSERFDEAIRVSYSKTEIVERVDDIEHELVREALRMTGIPRKIEIITVADVPSHGTGLGSSSAVTVGLLNALFAYQGIFKAPDELAAAASHIEIDVLGKPIGRQDQYASASGDLQLIRFGRAGAVRRDPLIMSPENVAELDKRLLMFYTGRSRQAGDVLGRVGDNIAQGGVTPDLVRMRDLALSLNERLAAADDLDLMGELLHENWLLKRGLDGSVSGPEIDDAYERALAAGALGGKLLGAGGGGFLLFYVRPEQQPSVRTALRDLRELPFRFAKEGSKIILFER